MIMFDERNFGNNNVFVPTLTIFTTVLVIASTFHLFKPRQIKKVCLFGTSANPPTKGGHKSIISSLSSLRSSDNLKSAKKFDEIRVLPVFKHMYSTKGDLASFHHRMEMCKIAFQDIPNINVSDQERKLFDYVAKKQGITSESEKMKLRVGTFDLLDYLDEENRNKGVKEEFTLAMGADTFMDLTTLKKWKKPKEIILMVEGRFVVKLRLGENSFSESQILERIKTVNRSFQEEIPSFQMRVELITESSSDTSSTAARETRDEEQLARYLDKNVIDYIKTNNLYMFSSQF